MASEFDWGYVEVPQRQHTTILIMRMALYGVKLLTITICRKINKYSRCPAFNAQLGLRFSETSQWKRILVTGLTQ